jgi:NAD(P)-dependent dehydrogenase (short-subunit alcohol dehydrogenase family)
MQTGLQNKTALVTGSTAGIGFAIAKGLLQEGATVIINGRTQARVDEAIAKLKAAVPNADVDGSIADFSKASDVEALIQSIPSVDILVNNVGIFEPRSFVDITDSDWLKFFEVNVLSGVRLARHYLPLMLQKNWGRIIFISSESAVNIPEEMIHYGTTKTAQLAVSRGLAELTKGSNVTVNAILPGPTKSEGVEGFIEDLGKHQNKDVATVEQEFFKTARPSSIIQRFAKTEEIANMVVYVASELSSATNGAALKVDGGVAKFII